jgi:hypothetical protein
VGTTQTAGDNSTKIATTAYVATAVTNGLGTLGTMATQNASAVAITGGTINGVSGTNASLTVGNATTAATVSTTVASGAVGTTQAAGTNNTQIATTAFVAAAMAVLYPIGSIYSSTVATNPNTLFGFGTWVAFAAGRVMIGNGGGFTAGATGGSADAVIVSHSHTATVTDAGHNHTFEYAPATWTVTGGASSVNSNRDGTGTTSTATTGITVANSTTGVSGINANLQPYIVVYMWNRTA